jgi:predicted transcriptional regulator
MLPRDPDTRWVDDMVSIKDLTVRDLMKETPFVAKKDQMLSEVLGKMKKHGIHEMPVVEKGKLLGFVDLDQLIRSRRVPMTSEVKSVMTPNPTISIDDSIPQAAKIMISSDSKAIPVIFKERYKGIITRTDIISRIFEIDELMGLKIEEVMTPDPTCIRDSDTVDYARKIMRELDERTLPVVDKTGVLIGNIDIIPLMEVMERQNLTKRSRARRVVGGKKRPRPLVRDIMTEAVTSVGRRTGLKEIIRTMRDTGATSVIITEMDRPVGIVTQWDLLEILASLIGEEGVHIQITGLANEDASVYDGIYWFVHKFLKKVAKLVRPTMLNIHGIEHMKDGLTVRYTFSVKLITTKRTYHINREGYEIFDVLDDCLIAIERLIEKKSDKKKQGRKSIRHLN